MAELQWVDSLGLASLKNGLGFSPATRFANWTPRNAPIGPAEYELGSGALHRFSFRTDNRVSFEITPIPQTEMEKMLRLQLHLLNGGAVVLVGTEIHPSYQRYPIATLAPDTEPEILFSDRLALEYTFAVELLTPGGSGAAGGAAGDPRNWLPTEEPSLIFWGKPRFETAYADTDKVATATDFSGNGNEALNAQTNSLRPTYKTGQTPAGGAVFEFHCTNNGNFSADLDTDAVDGEPEYLRTPPLEIPSDGLNIIFAGRLNGAQPEHSNYYRLVTAGNNHGLTLKSGGVGQVLRWDESAIEIPGSNAGEWFVHGMRFESATSARQFFMDAEVAGSAYNPSGNADFLSALIMGGGSNFQCCEQQVFSGPAFTDAKMIRRLQYVLADHEIG